MSLVVVNKTAERLRVVECGNVETDTSAEMYDFQTEKLREDKVSPSNSNCSEPLQFHFTEPVPTHARITSFDSNIIALTTSKDVRRKTTTKRKNASFEVAVFEEHASTRGQVSLKISFMDRICS